MTREELRDEVIKLAGNASEQILLIVKSVLELQKEPAILAGVEPVTEAKAADGQLTNEEDDAKAVSQMLHHGGQSRDEFEACYPHLFSK